MLKRLYANGFRCFVDFEYRPGDRDLLLGRPGTGRSSIRRIVENLQDFLLPWDENAALCDSFWADSHTRWLAGSVQSFELEIEHRAHRFAYRVAAHFTDDEYRPVLTSEQLRCDGQLLFTFEQDPEDPGVSGAPDDPSEDELPIPPSLQALAGNGHYLRKQLGSTSDARLQIFRDWWESAVWNLQLGNDDVRNLEGEALWPGVGFASFTPWVRHMLRTDHQRVVAMNRELTEVLDGYLGLRLPENERTHVDALFDNPAGGDPIAINFDDLAREQRVLIQLYSIVHLALAPGRVLLLDAPDAALSRDALRRWLHSLLRASRGISMQLMVIVNEPDILDGLPDGAIQRFQRERGGPTVVTREPVDAPRAPGA